MAAKQLSGAGAPSQNASLFTNKALYALFLPLIAEQLLSYLVGLADSMMVSYIGEAAVAGVSVVYGVLQCLLGLIAALTTGGAVIVGQYWGAKDKANSCEAARQLIWFIGIASLLMTVLLYAVEPLLWRVLFGTIAADVRMEAEIYFRIVAASIPFLALYSAAAAIFRVTGNSKTPMQIMLAMNLLNVLGNAALGYAAGLGTAGIAIATLIARMVAAGLLLALLMRKDCPIRLKREGTIRFVWPMLRRILRVGVPFGIENGFFYCGRVMVLSLASSYGTVSIAAGSVAGSIAVFTTMLGMSVNLGMTAVISKCIGSGSYHQAKYYHKKIMCAVFAAHLLVNLLLVAVLPLLLAAYNLTEEVAALTSRIVVWHAVMAVLVWPLAYMQPVTFRAAGDTQYPMKIGVVTMLLCRIVMSYVLGSYLGMGVMGIFMAIFLEWLVKAVLFTRYYLRGQWMRGCAIAR